MVREDLEPVFSLAKLEGEPIPPHVPTPVRHVLPLPCPSQLALVSRGACGLSLAHCPLAKPGRERAFFCTRGHTAGKKSQEWRGRVWGCGQQ